MKPYIDIADETQVLHMSKWNRNQYKSQIVTMIDSFDKEKLQKVVQFIKELTWNTKKFTESVNAVDNI